MKQLGFDLKEHADEVQRLWREVLQEPPLRLPVDHDLGQLPEILHDLVEVSLLHPHSIEAHRHKIVAAIRHGEHCRQTGQHERIIYEEFTALREALRRYLLICRLPKWKFREALIRLDMAISVAELAAIRGYYREMFEQIGKWEDLPDQLAQQSPLLGLPEP